MKLDATNLDDPLGHFHLLSDGTLIAALALINVLWLAGWLLGAPVYAAYGCLTRVLVDSLRRSDYLRVLSLKGLKYRYLYRNYKKGRASGFHERSAW